MKAATHKQGVPNETRNQQPRQLKRINTPFQPIKTELSSIRNYKQSEIRRIFSELSSEGLTKGKRRYLEELVRKSPSAIEELLQLISEHLDLLSSEKARSTSYFKNRKFERACKLLCSIVKLEAEHSENAYSLLRNSLTSFSSPEAVKKVLNEFDSDPHLILDLQKSFSQKPTRATYDDYLPKKQCEDALFYSSLNLLEKANSEHDVWKITIIASVLEGKVSERAFELLSKYAEKTTKEKRYFFSGNRSTVINSIGRAFNEFELSEKKKRNFAEVIKLGSEDIGGHRKIFANNCVRTVSEMMLALESEGKLPLNLAQRLRIEYSWKMKKFMADENNPKWERKIVYRAHKLLDKQVPDWEVKFWARI